MEIRESEMNIGEYFNLSRERMIGDYIVTKMIGSGSFAVVWRGKHKWTSMDVAIKEISLNKLNKKLKESLESEMSVLKTARHSNIIRLIEIIKNPHHIYLVLEYCSGGDLSEYIKRKGRLSENVARSFMSQLGDGLRTLRSLNLIHRDLKPQNLLLSSCDEDSILKIADFGFARSLQPQGMADTLCGSPLYMAPEILLCQKYDAKADLWSVGVILYEMLTGKTPFGGINHVQLLRNIERSNVIFPHPLSSLLSPSCMDICRKLLRKNPIERLSFEEYFHHPFLMSHKGNYNTLCRNVTVTNIHNFPSSKVHNVDEDYPFAFDSEFSIPSTSQLNEHIIIDKNLNEITKDKNDEVKGKEEFKMREEASWKLGIGELTQTNANQKKDDLQYLFENDYVLLNESSLALIDSKESNSYNNNNNNNNNSNSNNKGIRNSKPKGYLNLNLNFLSNNPISYFSSKSKEDRIGNSFENVDRFENLKWMKNESEKMKKQRTSTLLIDELEDLSIEEKKEDMDSFLPFLLLLFDISVSLITKIAEEKMKSKLPLHASSLHLICLSIFRAGIKFSELPEKKNSKKKIFPPHFNPPELTISKNPKKTNINSNSNSNRNSTNSNNSNVFENLTSFEIRSAFEPLLGILGLDMSTEPCNFHEAYSARLKFVNENVLKCIPPSQENLPYGFGILYEKAIQLGRMGGGLDEVLENKEKKRRSCIVASFLFKFLLFLAPLLPRPSPFLLSPHDFERLKLFSEEMDQRLESV